MTRRLARHCVRGAVGLGICAGFGWCMAEVMTGLNNYVNHA